jgi:hypothetical protein
LIITKRLYRAGYFIVNTSTCFLQMIVWNWMWCNGERATDIHKAVPKHHVMMGCRETKLKISAVLSSSLCSGGCCTRAFCLFPQVTEFPRYPRSMRR